MSEHAIEMIVIVVGEAVNKLFDVHFVRDERKLKFFAQYGAPTQRK